jgi:hypothetical protein
MSGVMGAGMDAETVRCEATYARLMPIDNRDAGRLGKAVEHLVAATCILTSGLELNVSTSFGDDEGVDLGSLAEDTRRPWQCRSRAGAWVAHPCRRERSEPKSATPRSPSVEIGSCSS